MTARILSLCSGYGGLDLAVEHVYDARTIAVADIDRDAATVLAERFPHAPNLGDLTTIDWAGWQTDILTAGYPCQPFSHAGRRQGEHDDRHIWPEVLRAVRALRPRLVVLENVRGHLSLGFGRVLGDLAESGYVGSWVCLRASDVGAPHARARVFVVAHPHGERLEVERRGGLLDRIGQAQRHDTHRRSTTAAADPARPGRQGRTGCPDPTQRPRPAPSGAPHWGPYEPAVRRWERTIGRPAPVALNPCSPKQVNARFVEWMMGLPEGWVTDLIPNRRALHTLGNGVVPQQAAHALRTLAAIGVAA